MDCLTNIVGITRNDCECLAGLLPDGYSTSTSGLYIDELPEAPLNLQAVKSAADCGQDVAAIFTRARDNAITEFKKDLYKQLAATYKPRYSTYTGLIGKTAGSVVLPTKAYMGVLLACKMAKGAYISISKVHVNINADATFDLKIYKRRSGETEYELLQTLSVEGTAAAVKTNTLADVVKLPLWDETEKEINYYFLYEPAGFAPKDCPISCGCGMSEYNLKAFMTPRGYTANSLSEVANSSGLQTNYANGVVLDVEVKCATDDIICQAMQADDFVKVAVEWIILRKSVANLIDGILHSGQITRHNEARREQMYYDKGSLLKKYNNDVQWVAENMSMGLNSCFVCNTSNEPFFIAGIQA